MVKILALGLIGFFAQLIDGALGMAYGVSSTTLLLTVGIAPAGASATVHLAEIATTCASGASHWRFGNVDWRVVSRLALPGFIGAFVGAVALSSLSAEAAEPIVAGILFVLGVYILVRFARGGRKAAQPRQGRVKAASSRRSACSPARWTRWAAAAGGRSAPRRCSRPGAWSRAR